MITPEVENRGIDERLFRYLCTAFTKIPSHNTLGMNLTYLGPGTAGIRMIVGYEYTSVEGRVHGGIIGSLVDTVQGWAIITLGYSPMTIDNYLNYLAPAFQDTELIAEAHIIKPGKTLTVVEADVSDNKGRLILKSRGNFIRDKNTPLFSIPQLAQEKQDIE